MKIFHVDSVSVFVAIWTSHGAGRLWLRLRRAVIFVAFCLKGPICFSPSRFARRRIALSRRLFPGTRNSDPGARNLKNFHGHSVGHLIHDPRRVPVS